MEWVDTQVRHKERLVTQKQRRKQLHAVAEGLIVNQRQVLNIRRVKRLYVVGV